MNILTRHTSSFIDLCSKEIENLHLFFENWYTGKIENNKDEFSRFSESLGKNFFLIHPGGNLVMRNDILELVKSNYGRYLSNPSDFKIWIENIKYHYQTDNNIVFSYEEWQKIGNETKARLNSVVFNISLMKDNIDKITWLHVHEVWISTENK